MKLPSATAAATALILAFGTTTPTTSFALTPSANTANYCESNAWGSETKLNDTCHRLYNQCKSGKLKHKGCKAFVRRWNYLIRQYR